jgi:hypothetical protein
MSISYPARHFTQNVLCILPSGCSYEYEYYRIIFSRVRSTCTESFVHFFAIWPSHQKCVELCAGGGHFPSGCFFRPASSSFGSGASLKGVDTRGFPLRIRAKAGKQRLRVRLHTSYFVLAQNYTLPLRSCKSLFAGTCGKDTSGNKAHNNFCSCL